MSAPPDPPSGPLPWLVRVVFRALVRTWRVEIVAGEDVFAELLASRRPVVWCLWHNRIVAGAAFLVRHMVPAGIDLAMMSSASRDGGLPAAVVAGHGVRVVRGSSSRGGARALRELVRLARVERSSPILVPDGPRGPVYRIKPGVIAASAATGAPILCAGFAANRAWVLGSWDRLVVPKPFARVTVALAAPLSVPRRPSAAESDRLTRELEERLHDRDRIAEAAAGMADPWGAEERTSGA